MSRRWELWQKVMLREECRKHGAHKNWHAISKLVGKDISQCKAMYHFLSRKPLTDLKLVIDQREKTIPDFSKFNLQVKD